MPGRVAVFAVNGEGKSLSIYPIVIVYCGQDQRYKTVPAFEPPIPFDHPTQADFDRVKQDLYNP